MIEISTIVYKRYMDTLGIKYDKVLNFCKSKKWGDDFKGTEYADIINKFQDAVIWILRKAKYYESVDVHYLEGLKNRDYKYDKRDIEKSRISVFKDFDRKELCDYFMYYTIETVKCEDCNNKEADIGYISEVINEKADTDVLVVINTILDDLKYNAAKYFYNSVKEEGWIDSRVKSRIYYILGIDEVRQECKDKRKDYHKILAERILSWIDWGSPVGKEVW